MEITTNNKVEKNMKKENNKSLIKKFLWAILIFILVFDLSAVVFGYFKYFKNIESDIRSYFGGEDVVIMFFPEDIKDIIDFNKYDDDYMTYTTYKPKSQKYKSILDEAAKIKKLKK